MNKIQFVLIFLIISLPLTAMEFSKIYGRIKVEKIATKPSCSTFSSLSIGAPLEYQERAELTDWLSDHLLKEMEKEEKTVFAKEKEKEKQELIVEITKLQEKGLNQQDAEGNTALMKAVVLRYLDVAEKLLQKGAIVNIKNKKEESVLNEVNSFAYALLCGNEDFKQRLQREAHKQEMYALLWCKKYNHFLNKLPNEVLKEIYKQLC